MRFRLLFTLGLGTTVMVWFLITPSYKMLGQKTVLRSPSLEVFLVTRHERLFLHYIGDAYSFGCRSDETKNFPEQKNLFLGPGVTPIPGPILRCDVTDEIRCDVEVLAPRARDSFFISSMVSWG